MGGINTPVFSGGSGIFYPHRRGVSKPHAAIPGRMLPSRACVRFTGYGKYGFPGFQSQGFAPIMAFVPSPLSGFMEFAVALFKNYLCSSSRFICRSDIPYGAMQTLSVVALDKAGDDSSCIVKAQWSAFSYAFLLIPRGFFLAGRALP